MPQKVSIPSNIDPSKILKIVGGACHTIFLTDEACYSCGSNKNGQLGNSSTEDSLNFIKVHIPEEETIIDVTCSWNSCMALTESGNVYVWGSNLNGQLGLEMSVKSMNKPFKLNLEEKVVKFAMGLRHSALITENGLLLVSGAQTNGQLGFSYSSKPDVRCIYNFVRGKASNTFYQFQFYNSSKSFDKSSRFGASSGRCFLWTVVYNCENDFNGLFDMWKQQIWSVFIQFRD